MPPTKTLAQFAPLPAQVQSMLAEQFPKLRASLASNSHLDSATWFKLYGSSCTSVVAERLLWRKDLTSIQVKHALKVRDETRKAPLVALFSAHPALHKEVNQLNFAKVPTQLADYFLLKNSDPVTQNKVVKHASFKVAALWMLRDHKAVSDKAIVSILTAEYPSAGAGWGILTGLLLDRPKVKSLLLKSRITPIFAGHLARTGIPGPEQQNFLEQLGALNAAKYSTSWYAAMITEIYLHPMTTKTTVRYIENHAVKDPAYARAVQLGNRVGGPLGWGQCPSKISSKRRLKHLLEDAYSQEIGPLGAPVHTWHLAALGHNPHLDTKDRALLTNILSDTRFKRALSNCDKSAVKIAKTGEGDFVPPTMWAIPTSIGSYKVLVERLGAPADAPYYVPGESNEQLAQIGRGADNARAAGTYLLEVFGDDRAVWEVAFSLADDFKGTTKEFAETCLAIVA